MEMAPLLLHHSLRQSTTVAPLETLVKCMCATPARRLDLQNFPHVLSGAPLYLDVTDIVRDREIGVPRYAEFRERMGLSVATTQLCGHYAGPGYTAAATAGVRDGRRRRLANRDDGGAQELILPDNFRRPAKSPANVICFCDVGESCQ
jgi:hypothetical protein